MVLAVILGIFTCLIEVSLAHSTDQAALGVSVNQPDYTQHVLPLYVIRRGGILGGKLTRCSTGTQNGGNMFPGVTRPFGVVKLGPDLYNGVDAYSGYLPTGNVTGYSLMHESGTGGAPKYGVVSQMPVAAKVVNPLANLALPRATDDAAQVGYYKSTLSSNVVTELAATDHAGLLRYTFPSGMPASVVIDVSHVLPSFRGLGLGQNYTGGNITITKDGHYEGSGTYNNGWNLGMLGRGIVDWILTTCSTRMDNLFLWLL